MTTAVGLEQGRGYIPVPVVRGNNGRRITVGGTPTTLALDPATEIVVIWSLDTTVFVGLGTVGTADGEFAAYAAQGAARALAVPRGTTLAFVTEGTSGTIFVEQY